tara:strand:+ start:834 stop:1019 length:186 start_codon:yes stop_codon:yes gene_type:complete
MLIKRLLEQYYRNYPNADNLDPLISFVGEREFIGIMLARMNKEIKLTVSEGDSKMVKYEYI